MRVFALVVWCSTALADVPGVPIQAPHGAAAEAETDRWMKIVREKGDHGGWLVVRGTHVGDNAVGAVTLGQLTHAAVLDKEKEEVIEAVAKGVQVTPLRALLASAHRLEVVRPPGWTAEEGKKAVARARSRVGQKYDWLGLVGAENDGRYYCTELAVDAYRGRERGWKLHRIIFPADVPKLGNVMFDSGPRKKEPETLVERFARRLENVRGVAYAAEVEPGLYRGGQPDADGVAWLKSIGIKTILNLRHFHGDTEKARVTAAGLRYEAVPLESSNAPKLEDLKRIMGLLTDPSLRPLYVHCAHGVDRTGTVMAVYRMEKMGWNNTEAFAEMDHFGAHRIWLDLRHYVKTYTPLGLWKK
jgi:hypothetical protein